jgi:diguanylate cyclase (GGDEF)-like protein
MLLSWLEDRSREQPPGCVAVLFVDLDRFKLVNDTHGHAAGDAVLVETARRLERTVRPVDVVGRLGGDEFVVAVGRTTACESRGLARRLLDAVRAPVEVGDRLLQVSASIGVALGLPGATPAALLRDADAALYRAKHAGRNRIAMFDDELRRAVVVRLDTEADLRSALERAEIFAHYQPIFDTRTGEAVAVEALARWDHPRRGLVSPTSFVPVAEESGLILSLSDVIFDAAAEAVATLEQVFGASEAIVWVNVSARQLEHPAFARQLIARIDAAGVAGRLGLEITERALTRDALATAASLRELDAAGLHLAVEDFGAGFSSLASLARNPVHTIKIDRAFIDDIEAPGTAAVVRATVELAHALGAVARAEGVESADQLDHVRSLGVDLVSGFHLGRPQPLDLLVRELRG